MPEKPSCLRFPLHGHMRRRQRGPDSGAREKIISAAQNCAAIVPSALPFLDYRAALLAGDAQRRRSAFGKTKGLLLLALVVLIVMLILSDRGFLGIQIGRG